MIFKPGDFIKFPGLFVNEPGLNLIIKPVEGKLILADSNTTQKGVMAVEGDKQRMMFLPDGTIYCHSKYGVMISYLIPFSIGDEVLCIMEVPDVLTKDKIYKVIKTVPETKSIAFTADNGVETLSPIHLFVATKNLAVES